MSVRPLYVGIDLGTTNSVAAVFDGETITTVRNAEGGVLTPSVVRIDRRGNASVGARARRFLESDPDNAHGEFKRLMGTEHRFEFRAAGLSRSPHELSSLLLGALRNDIQAQLGVAPCKAVVSVPALFELPQTSATSVAARLAGFEQIEMIQEPVASALASGWKHDQDSGAWLVYDLGGGTFDASLLESQDGLLRVVGQDGDNFLGGRDFDARIVDHLLAELERSGGPRIERKNPAHAALLRRLRLLAEEAKIELTRAESASITCPNLELAGEPFDLDLELERSVLERLIEPLIERTIQVCLRLLGSKGLNAGALSRVVLVGALDEVERLRDALHLGCESKDLPSSERWRLWAKLRAKLDAAWRLGADPESTFESVVVELISVSVKLWNERGERVLAREIGRFLDRHRQLTPDTARRELIQSNQNIMGCP